MLFRIVGLQVAMHSYFRLVPFFIRLDIVWSDPENIDYWAVNPRGAGWLFGQRVVKEVSLSVCQPSNGRVSQSSQSVSQS